MSLVRKAIGLTCVDPRMMPEATRQAISRRLEVKANKIYLVTDPGIVALLCESTKYLEHVVEQVGQLISLGHVEYLVACGHQDCQVNVVPDEIQLNQIRCSVHLLKKAFPGLHCSGLFLRQAEQTDHGWLPAWL